MKQAEEADGARPVGGAVVRREEMTYERHKPVSWFVDRVRSQILQDVEARARLEQHAREFDVEMRTNPNTRAGTGGEFAPPVYLIPQFSPAAAGGRVLADLIDQVGNLFVLPPGVAQIVVPRIVAGATEGVQAQQGGADPGSDPTTAGATGSGQIVTISGEVIVSQQLLDLTPAPGADAAFVADLNSNYNQQLELQMLTGNGLNGQLLGLKNVSGRNTVAGGSMNTIATLWPGIGQMMAAVGNTRLQPVSHLIVAPRRWAWIASSVDSSNRPIASPGADSPRVPSYPLIGAGSATTGPWMDNTQEFRGVGPINGCPVWQSGAILTQGTAVNTATDDIYGVRPKDMQLYESGPKVLVATNPVSGTLQVRIRLARYVSFIPDRYPSGIGVITAVPAPTNF